MSDIQILSYIKILDRKISNQIELDIFKNLIIQLRIKNYELFYRYSQNTKNLSSAKIVENKICFYV